MEQRANRYTLIATVRNEKDTIVEFIESILAQTRQVDEMIIVDGESNDGTLAILETYSTRNPQIKIISQNCNIAQGRNIAVRHSTGTHILATDAGCKIEPIWAEKMIECFENDSEVDVVSGNFALETFTPFEDAVIRATFSTIDTRNAENRRFPSSRSVAFSKSAWERAGGYPEWLYAGEDTLFTIKLRQIGCKFAFAREAIVRWRPRQTWRALAKQRINFARGNARTGFRDPDAFANLRTHLLIVLSMGLALWKLPFLIFSAIIVGGFLSRKIWPQAKKTTQGDNLNTKLRVIAIIEFVRIVNIYGFFLGKIDRVKDEKFIEQLQNYAGVSSVEELPDNIKN